MYGLWWGLTCGLGSLAIAYVILWARIDWAKEAKVAQTHTGLQAQLLNGERGGGGLDTDQVKRGTQSEYGAVTDTGQVARM